MRGRDCTRNADCACSNYQAVEPLICNYNLKCESFFDTLAKRIPVSYSNTDVFDFGHVNENVSFDWLKETFKNKKTEII